MNKRNHEIKDEELNQVTGGVILFDQIPHGLKLECKSCGSANVRKGDQETYFTCCDCGKTFKLSSDSSAFVF